MRAPSDGLSPTIADPWRRPRLLLPSASALADRLVAARARRLVVGGGDHRVQEPGLRAVSGRSAARRRSATSSIALHTLAERCWAVRL